MSQGAIFAVYCTGHATELTNFSVGFNTTGPDLQSFIQFTASPSPSPAPAPPAIPMYEGPNDNDYNDPNNFVSNE